MNSFQDVNQVRVALKMKLSKYAWYCGSHCSMVKNNLHIKVSVSEINDTVRKIVPKIVNGIEIKLEVV